jgi:hypothetical protein
MSAYGYSKAAIYCGSEFHVMNMEANLPQTFLKQITKPRGITKAVPVSVNRSIVTREGGSQ